tara:strand:+ start:1688 stop:2143 length:456 start_codon:yes stop_codon:yes gene_type:complete
MSENIWKFDSIYQGEYAIQNLIKSDNNCSAHFTYNRYPGKGYELIIVTYNPTHQTSFFLHGLEGETKIQALEKMYEHIHNLKNSLGKKDSPYLHYIVEWYNSKLNKKVTSSFYGTRIQDIINKFYYGKHNKKEILIYSIKLNNITNNDVIH